MLLDFHQARALILGACAVFILVAVFLTTNHHPQAHSRFGSDFAKKSQSFFHSSAAPQRWRELTDVWTGRTDPTRIMLASVLYDEPEPNDLLERALLTHEKHAERWGYATRVLRKRLVDGWWGKWGWLQTLVTEELSKDEGEGAEWIMFLSPTAVLNDPTIPLSLFLPPPTITINTTTSPGQQEIPLSSIHFLGAYDPSSPLTSNPNYPALTPSAFFLRIHPWTLTFLHHLLAAPLLNPPIADEALALAKTLSDTLLYPDDTDPFPHVILQPERWYAWSPSSEDEEEEEEEEEERYHLRAATHFPPTTSAGGSRWKSLHDAVSAVEKGRLDRAYPFGFAPPASSSSSSSLFSSTTPSEEQTPDALSTPEIHRFWTRLAGARAALDAAAAEVRERWGGDAEGEGEGDEERWVSLVEGMAEVAGAVAWGGGRGARVLEGAVEGLRGVVMAGGTEGAEGTGTGGGAGRGVVGTEF